MFVSKLENSTVQPLEQNNILKRKGRYQSRVTQVAWPKGEGKDIVHNMSTLAL